MTIRSLIFFLTLSLICSGLARAQTNLVEVTVLTFPEDAKIYLDIPSVTSQKDGHYLGRSGTPIKLDRSMIKEASHFPIRIVKEGYEPKFEKIPNYWSLPQYPEEGKIFLDPSSTWIALDALVQTYPIAISSLGVASFFLFFYLRRQRKRTRETVDRADAIIRHEVQLDSGDQNIAAKVGSYRLIERLGEGTFAKVYKGLPDDTLNPEQAVAVKLLDIDMEKDGESLGRFYREVKLCRKLDHPNIVKIYDWGEQRGMLYLAMELADGGSLKEVATAGGLTVDEALTYLLPVLRGMDYANKQGVIHRDLKPANILLTRDKVPKIADFGLARQAKGGEDLTATNVGVGTPAYMAPEQMSNAKGVDSRCDQFSLGVLAYYLLTGVHPYKTDDSMKTLFKIFTEDAPLMSEIKPDLPPELVSVVARMLSRKPEARFPDLDEVIEIFENASNLSKS